MVLQSEVRLHEGILASLALQDTWEEHVQERVQIANQLEQAIANLKAALKTDETNGLIADRMLHLLFNLQEMIARLRASLDLVLAYRHKVECKDAAYSAFLAKHPGALADGIDADGIDWMEDLAETWSLSLDRPFMADIESRLVTQPRPASEIRDWRAVLDEVERDAAIQG